MGLRQCSARLIVGAGIVVAVLTLSATAASAHAALVSTSPEQSQTFPSGQGPKTVSVTFDEAVHATPSSLAVYDGAGKALALQGLTPEFKATLTAALPTLSDGTFVTTWHVVSDDGHSEQGAFTFTVGKGGVAANIGDLLASGSPSEPLVIVFGIDRALAYVGTLAVLGGLLFVRWCWPDARRRRDLRRLLVAASVLGIVATLLTIPLEAAYSSTNGFGSLVNGSALHDVVWARFGKAALLRSVLLLGTLPLILGKDRTASGSRRRTPEVLLALLSLGVWCSIAWGGHAFSGRWVVLGFTTDLVHLASASIWFGGLVVLAVAVRPATMTKGAGEAVASFSTLALPAVGLLVLSGVVQGWRQVGSFSALLHTTYGHLLSVKVILVFAIVVVASTGRHLVSRRLIPALRSVGRPVQETLDGEAHTIRELRDGIWAEVALAIAVLGVTSALVFTAPAREAALAAEGPSTRVVHVHSTSAGVRYGLVAQPGLQGVNTLAITPRLIDATHFLPTSLAGRLSGPGARHSKHVTFTPLADGRWVASVTFTSSGSWTLVLLESDGTISSTAKLTIPVG